MKEKDDTVMIAVAEPHEDVDDLIFRTENDWYTSDR